MRRRTLARRRCELSKQSECVAVASAAHQHLHRLIVGDDVALCEGTCVEQHWRSRVEFCVAVVSKRANRSDKDVVVLAQPFGSDQSCVT